MFIYTPWYSMFTMVNNKTTHIRISTRVKKHLTKLKIHKRETFNDIIERMLKER